MRFLGPYKYPAACFLGGLLLAQPRAADYLEPAGSLGAPRTEAVLETDPHREWLRWWIFDVSPRLAAQTIYDDNITIRSDTKEGDAIFTASPGLTAVAGDQLSERPRLLTLSYSPTFIKFLENSQYDSIDHSGSIRGIWPFSKLTLGFSQTYDQSSGGVVDIGNRVDRKSYNTGLTSSYELSEKTSFEINARQAIQDYPEPYIGTKEWSNDDWINYLVAAKVVLGIGFTFGYIDVDRNPGQQYERLLVRAVYKLTYKVDVTASVGGELRQYEDGPSRAGAIFSLGASYWPRDGTTINLEAHRDNRNSALFAGQNYISTGFSLSVRQRFMDRFFVAVGGSYENAAYESAINGVAATRSEDYYLANASADIAITARWLAGLFFRHRENISSIGGLSFNNNQIGIQTSYQF